MTHKEELESLHKQSLTTFEAYINKKKEERISDDDHEKIHQQKKDWEVAWNKLMETLLVLERLEI